MRKNLYCKISTLYDIIRNHEKEGICNGSTNTTISNSDELWKAADPFTFQVGTGADSNSTITVETGFVIPIIDLNICSKVNSNVIWIVKF